MLDAIAGTMLQTDGDGPAHIAPYRGRDGGPLSILDPFGSPVTYANMLGGDPATLGGIVGGSGVERWRARVLQSLRMIGQPASYADYVLNQIRTESSGDPNVINLTDANAQQGDPSKGLVQVIWSTFQSELLNHGFGSYIAKGQFDPLANLLAGELWAIDQYGSIPAGMRGVAYDNGGVLPPGVTMAYNGTGQNEQNLTNNQWATAKAAVQTATATGGRPMNITVNNYLDGQQIASRTEYIVDGKFLDFARAVDRQKVQAL